VIQKKIYNSLYLSNNLTCNHLSILCRPYLFLIFLSLTVILLGCVSICSWDDGYSQMLSSPKEEAIIGIYYLTSASKETYTERGLDLRDTRLELRSNHEYVLIDAPSSMIDYQSTNQPFVKAGRWSVTSDKSNGCLIELEGVCVVPLCKKNNVISIPIDLGDPDECEGIVFEHLK